ncbi:MAG TPA: hypothetical protein VLF66_17655 [Thermoanaerobaculia bacterium]|nr:hypothetical protein [Thermoanaerobaculia bacterium]
MFAPDYLICLECETPCYVFEWRGDRVVEALCQICGNDDPELFATPAEMEDLTEG